MKTLFQLSSLLCLLVLSGCKSLLSYDYLTIDRYCESVPHLDTARPIMTQRWFGKEILLPLAGGGTAELDFVSIDPWHKSIYGVIDAGLGHPECLKLQSTLGPGGERAVEIFLKGMVPGAPKSDCNSTYINRAWEHAVRNGNDPLAVAAGIPPTGCPLTHSGGWVAY